MANTLNFSPTIVAATLLSVLIIRGIYRLTLHPLARFPGPFWARVTSAYGISYDLWPTSQGYLKKFPEFHDEYGKISSREAHPHPNYKTGPIIRCHPNELHIRDLDAFYQVFRPGTPFNKDTGFYNIPATRGFFTIPNTKDAKPWKDVYAPYFSRAAILRLEPLIHAQLNTFLMKMKDLATQEKVVDLTLGFRCFTNDIVMGYCFADKGFHCMANQGFRAPTVLALEKYVSLHQTLTHVRDAPFCA
jgi:hypothetical protein